jgi:5'-deoxynucleotidase YfbR-like HD superfamily hydrolase
VLVEALCGDLAPAWPAKWRLAALLHDAPEYVIGDMISPFKAALGLDYRAFEDRLATAIHLRFGLPAAVPATVKAIIKQADRISAYLEATQLAGFEDQEAQRYFTKPKIGLSRKLQPLPAEAAQASFLARFHALID